MPSTATTTKKPDHGSCAACNKEGAVFRCAPCRDAGVDVFFCNRECQVKLWKIHKAFCGQVSTTDSETKQEMMKRLQHRDELCYNCFKKNAGIGSKMSICSKCKKAFYCSRECQVAHWPKHKGLCKHNCEVTKSMERSVALDSTGKKIQNLFEKWSLDGPTPAISGAVYLALEKKDIRQQPPVKVVLMELEFNYNAQTFIVTEEPRAVAIADLGQGQKEEFCKFHKDFIMKAPGGLDMVYTQFAFVSLKGLGKRIDTVAPVFFEESTLRQKSNVSMRSIRFHCAQARLRSDLFRGWKSIRRNNLQNQIKKMKLGQSYTAFVQNALQFFCNKSLQNTHRIVVKVKMGKEIGQISEFYGYEVVSMAQFKECKVEVENLFIHVEDTESRQPLCTEMAIKTLFVDNEICFTFDFVLNCEVNVTQNKTAKQCKKAADKHFRKLQQEINKMPSDLLEKVSL
ncbi:hypothetical protein CTEN210_17773 [Chaetoceros tenuissimus]|uniref:MYND-type domain-containing protein n=1 Tax=Chaetoceros tenuissimus TaxID=426638 RepID=A0AAD3DC80_9STRA|nr:hypothetical protein CTEN210_17773 [Chaetoceros tenuissimus]